MHICHLMNKNLKLGGTRVVLPVKHPTPGFGSGHDFRVEGGAPCFA